MNAQPHQVSSWSSDRNGTANAFLDLIDKINDAIDDAGYSNNLTAKYDVPRYYSNYLIKRETNYSDSVSLNGETKYLSDWILDAANMMIFDYVDTFSRFTDDASEELTYGEYIATNNIRDNVEIDVVGSVECDIGSQPESITFCGESDELEGVLFNATKFFEASYSGAFGMVGIYFYQEYLNMTRSEYTSDISAGCGDSNAWRTLYVWSTDIVDSENMDSFLQWCADYCISKIYLEAESLTSDSSGDYQLLASFLNASYTYDVEVELLLAYAQWVKRSNHDECLHAVDNVLTFISTLNLVEIEEPPDFEIEYYVKQIPNVLHLDIEPHTLDQWDNDTNGTANAFLDLVAKINNKINWYGMNDEIHAKYDIPRWYNNRMIKRNTNYSSSKQYNGEIKSLSDWVLDAANIMIMNYVDDVDRYVYNTYFITTILS